jgi:monoamine oxidase
VSVTASTVPLERMSLVALARKQAARAGHGAGSELRLADGAGGFASRLAAALPGAVHTGARAVAVAPRRGGVAVALAGGPPVRARRAVVAVPLHARRRIAGLPPVPAGGYGVAAKSLILLAAEPPPDAPRLALTDTPLGFAYRHGPRALVSFVGGRPAARLLRLGPVADREVAAAARRAFGAPVARIVRAAWPRSYLILAPGELAGWAARLAEPAGRVHMAGAEMSALPSFMEGAVRAGERAAAEALAQL